MICRKMATTTSCVIRPNFHIFLAAERRSLNERDDRTVKSGAWVFGTLSQIASAVVVPAPDTVKEAGVLSAFTAMDCEIVVVASAPCTAGSVPAVLPSSVVRGCGWAGAASVWTDSPFCVVAASSVLVCIVTTSTSSRPPHWKTVTVAKKQFLVHRERERLSDYPGGRREASVGSSEFLGTDREWETITSRSRQSLIGIVGQQLAS